MKTKLILSVMISSIILANVACSNNANEEQKKKTEVNNHVNIDSLENIWDEAWTTGNVDNIKEMLDDDAIVFENEWVVRGKDSLMKRFVIPNSAAMKAMTTTKIKDGVSDGIAYRIGHYNITLKDSTMAGSEGPFTIIWKKNESGQWKVVSLQTGTDKK